MRTHTTTRVAAVLVALEGCGLLALAAWQAVALAAGDTESVTSALALIVFTIIAGAAVLAFGFAVWRGHSWGRSGGIVTQIMILAVALGAATGAYADPSTALALAAPALVTFLALVLSARAAGKAASEASGDAVEPPADRS